ncbi:DNA replication factor GINS [Haladaptatus litoreus]|uniref:DNA replication factor GINS n=1 Tax=Haladaptatus litoreus TaxID=553468 RepID=A0A1N6Z393_9EURY|nr:hypothetical protein [Haladaptatus litoreus]SIR21280.1 DNA replication factor GINS [Haladaptatus litoreus]
MNLDELRSVQSKERSKDSLQHLRESFYEDVGSYIGSLRDERERAAERADNPFDSSEVNRLTDEIQTAEDVVEAIYERRVGKVVKRASLSAAGIPADEEGLTNEEQELFSDLVERIESNKSTVLDVLAGEESGGSPEPPTEQGGADSASPEVEQSDSDPVGAESAAATSKAETSMETTGSEPNSASDDHRPSAEAAAIAGNSEDAAPAGTASSTETPDGTSETSAEEHDPVDEPEPSLSDERTTVRITRDIGEILGVDEREYDLATEDVVTLPAENAGPLIERDAAEKLD